MPSPINLQELFRYLRQSKELKGVEMWELRPIVGAKYVEMQDGSKSLMELGIVANTVLVVQDLS